MSVSAHMVALRKLISLCKPILYIGYARELAAVSSYADVRPSSPFRSGRRRTNEVICNVKCSD